MAEEIKPVAPEVLPTIVETPEPKPAPTVAEALYKDTPSGEVKPPVIEPEKKIDTAAPITTETKPPTEPVKDQAKPAGETAPVEYDLKLPENSALTKEDLDALSKQAKEQGLTKEQAEARLKTENDVAVRTMTRFQQQQATTVKTEQAKWVDLIKNDSELGGDKYNQTVAEASRAFKATASPELQKIIRDSGLGNHPEYVRQMARIGRMMAEDTVIVGRSGGVSRDKPTAEALYGATTPGADGKLPGA